MCPVPPQGCLLGKLPCSHLLGGEPMAFLAFRWCVWPLALLQNSTATSDLSLFLARDDPDGPARPHHWVDLEVCLCNTASFCRHLLPLRVVFEQPWVVQIPELDYGSGSGCAAHPESPHGQHVAIPVPTRQFIEAMFPGDGKCPTRGRVGHGCVLK